MRKINCPRRTSLHRKRIHSATRRRHLGLPPEGSRDGIRAGTDAIMTSNWSVLIVVWLVIWGDFVSEFIFIFFLGKMDTLWQNKKHTNINFNLAVPIDALDWAYRQFKTFCLKNAFAKHSSTLFIRAILPVHFDHYFVNGWMSLSMLLLD